MGNREFLRLDGEVVIFELPSEILRSDHGRGETTESVLIRDVESGGVVYRGTLVGSIKGGQLHISNGNLCGPIDPADVYRTWEGDDCRKYAGVGDLMKRVTVNMRRWNCMGLRTVPCMDNRKLVQKG